MSTKLEQLEFLPPSPLRGRTKRVPVRTIVGDREAEMVGPKGTKAFVHSIEVFGVTNAIQLEELPDGRYKIIDGRRRLRAVMELAQRTRPEGVTAAQWRNRWQTIPAVIFPPGGWSPEVMAAHANEQRGDNNAILLGTAEHLVSKGLSEAEMVEILGVPVQRLRRVLRMQSLHPALRRALEADEISQTVAEDVAKLPPALQDQLAEAFAEKGELTAAMVKDVRRVRREAAVVDTLPMEGIDDPLLPSAPAEAAVAGWRALLAEKLTECIRIADAYDQIPLKLALASVEAEWLAGQLV